jgi:hypothetical protein
MACSEEAQGSSPASRAALGDHQRPDRLHRPVAALRRARCPAGLGGPRGADRIQRVGLALPVPVLPVRPVHLHDPDPGTGHVPGQARAVTTGALDADQGGTPELAQPFQQVSVPGGQLAQVSGRPQDVMSAPGSCR